MHGMDMPSGGDGAECKISMLFNFYTIDACFLSSGWHIRNNGMFAATCIGVILLVVLVELCRRIGKEYDDFLTRQFRRQATAILAANKTSSSSCASAGPGFGNSSSHSSSSDDERGSPAASRSVTFRTTPLQQLARAVIHAVTFGGAYIIMLLVMYFNVYIIVCVFIGAGLGKYLCDWMIVTVDLGSLETREKHLVEDTTLCCG